MITLAQIAAWHLARAKSLREAAEGMRRAGRVNEAAMAESPCDWHEAAARVLLALAAEER